jgi:hypothetical protein
MTNSSAVSISFRNMDSCQELFKTVNSIQIKGDEVPKPLRIERIPLIEKLSSSEMDSLRDGLKVSADPQCIEALQETIIKVRFRSAMQAKCIERPI